MQTRRFGRTGWVVGEVGFGMWAMGGEWGSTDDARAANALDRAAESGCTLYDTALSYGAGHSERLLGDLLRRRSGDSTLVATKIPPKNRQLPARPGCRLEDAFPPEHVRESVRASLRNLRVDRIDLLQFHVWRDEWAPDTRWQRVVQELSEEGLVRAWGICTNRWEPRNCVQTLETGLIDAVQVTYNVFEQAPEDLLLPACSRLDIAVVARVPFDEGSLTGVLERHTTFPADDWRSGYFRPDTVPAIIERVERVRRVVPDAMSLPEAALRFVLAQRAVSVVIPGMRSRRHVEQNIAVSDGRPLPGRLLEDLRGCRWDRGGH